MTEQEEKKGEEMLGSLSALSALESEAAERQKKEARARHRQKDRHRQSQKVEKLRQRRDELLQILRDKTNSEAAHRKEGRSDTDTEGAVDKRTSALAYVAELKGKLEVYRMTGVAVVEASQDSKVLCFTTSHQGVYLEPYHLKLQRLTSGHFKVAHHDLPPFVAYSALPRDLQVKDTLSAVRPVQEALAMFVRRREELKAAQSEFSDKLHVTESSAAVDYLCCHLDVSDKVQVQITLKYDNLNTYLPTSVKAELVGKDGRRRVKENLPPDILDSTFTHLYSHPLSAALSKTADLLQGLLHTG